MCPSLQLESLTSDKTSLLTLWDERKAQFHECMELQLFMRDADQAENWIAKQEVCFDRIELNVNLKHFSALEHELGIGPKLANSFISQI